MTDTATALNRHAIDTAVARAYAEHGTLDNAELYSQVSHDLGVQMELFCGPSAETGYNDNARAARWAQQTLKTRGLIERIDRGRWRITADGSAKLRRPMRGFHLVAFSTDLGAAVWGDCRDVFGAIDEPITLCVTSPPYPIMKGRAYGRIDPVNYVDWLCDVLASVVERLAPGGSIALVLGNDVFESKSPARVPYVERLTLALIDRLGLWKMDDIIWHNGSKAPGPVRYASIERTQLNAGYEHILWMTNDPSQVKADNRRVLEPHTARQQALIDAGGEMRATCHQDGHYRLRPGQSFARATSGRIPRNVLSTGHDCVGQQAYKRAAAALGLPIHGAPLTARVVRFVMQFLSAEGDLVVDPMAGSQTTAAVAQELGRRWLTSEQYGEYLRGGAERVRDGDGYALNPDFAAAIAA